ncbi:MAG: hypothetical protein HYX77_01880 [Acidobacteria bacterium]|nr:hypothetical protein [Acidobacteriota bacterium]
MQIEEPASGDIVILDLNGKMTLGEGDEILKDEVNGDGSLKLLGLTKRITDLLTITKLLTVFETYDNEADAVQSFSSSASV